MSHNFDIVNQVEAYLNSYLTGIKKFSGSEYVDKTMNAIDKAGWKFYQSLRPLEEEGLKVNVTRVLKVEFNVDNAHSGFKAEGIYHVLTTMPAHDQRAPKAKSHHLNVPIDISRFVLPEPFKIKILVGVNAINKFVEHLGYSAETDEALGCELTKLFGLPSTAVAGTLSKGPKNTRVVTATFTTIRNR